MNCVNDDSMYRKTSPLTLHVTTKQQVDVIEAFSQSQVTDLRRGKTTSNDDERCSASTLDVSRRELVRSVSECTGVSPALADAERTFGSLEVWRHSWTAWWTHGASDCVGRVMNQ